MHIYICANEACKKIFTPSTEPRKRFGKYCSKECMNTRIPQDHKGLKGSHNKPTSTFNRNWRDNVQPGAMVYLTQDTSVIFEVVFAEREIAWIKPHHVSEGHKKFTCRPDCRCQSEKLVLLSRCDMVRA